MGRLARMSEILNVLAEHIYSEKWFIIFGIARLLTTMLIVGHLIACFWYGIGASITSMDSTWLNHFQYDDKSLGYRYVMSLRWAISQFAGGMDEVQPKNLYESVFATSVYLAAFWFGAVFLSMLTSSMTQLYIDGSHRS